MSFVIFMYINVYILGLLLKTLIDLAKECINKTFNIIGGKNISGIIEPSTGNGSFSNQIPNCIAYDLIPENEND